MRFGLALESPIFKNLGCIRKRRGFLAPTPMLEGSRDHSHALIVQRRLRPERRKDIPRPHR